MKIAVFHNLPSGGALKALSKMMEVLQKRRHKLSLYSFSTAEHDFVSYPELQEEPVIEPLHYEGWNRFDAYRKVSRRVADRINQSDCDFVFVHKCRFMGAPSILQYLKKTHSLFCSRATSF